MLEVVSAYKVRETGAQGRYSSHLQPASKTRQGRQRQEEKRQFLTQLNVLSPYDPAMALHGVYPKEVKTSVHTKPCSTEVYCGFLTDRQNPEQQSRPSAGSCTD